MAECVFLFLQFLPSGMLFASILIGAVVGLVARDKKVMVNTMIRYMMLLAIGATCLWEFVIQFFFPSAAAIAISSAQSAFQGEVALANLGLALAGLWAFKSGFDCWVSVAVMATCFNAGTALLYVWRVGLLSEPTGFGRMLYTDILTVFVLNMLLCYAYMLDRERIVT